MACAASEGALPGALTTSEPRPKKIQKVERGADGAMGGMVCGSFSWVEPGDLRSSQLTELRDLDGLDP